MANIHDLRIRGLRVDGMRTNASRNVSLILVWYPGPFARKYASTSASSRRVVNTFVGALCGPRPRRRIAGPSIASVHGGLSRSSTFAKLRLDGFKVVTRFIAFGLAKRNDVQLAATALGVNEDHDLAVH